MDKFYLESPSLKRKNDILDYFDELNKYNSEIHGAGFLDNIYNGYSFDEALAFSLNLEDENFAKEHELCPGKTFLLIRKNDNKLIGTINIRWNLNDYMQNYGGNIGYTIRPTERMKGYNKINLYLCLKEAKGFYLKEVSLSCDVSNLGSNKTIQALGGVLKYTVSDPTSNEMINFYVIDVNESLLKYCDLYEKFI